MFRYSDYIIYWLIFCLRIFVAFYSIAAFRNYLRILPILSIAVGLALYRVGIADYKNLSLETLTLWQTAIIAIAEALRGFLSAIPFSIMIEVFGISVRLIEICRGTQFAEQHFPGMEIRVCQLEGLMMLFSVLVFWELFAENFFAVLLIPEMIVNYTAGELFVLDLKLLESYCREYLSVLIVSTKIALPVIVGSIVIDLIIGLIQRVSGKNLLVSEGLTAKMLIGMIIFWVYIRIGFDYSELGRIMVVP